MIGFSSPALTVRPFKEAAEHVLPHFEHWEIISEADHFLPDIKDELRELLETTNLKASVHAPFSDINLAAFDNATRKYSIDLLGEIFRIASELNIDVVTIHPGVIGPIQYYDKLRVEKVQRESLETLSSHSDEYSCAIALENMPDMRYATCKTAEEIERMLDGLDIGMCFDIGHANTTGQLPEMCRLQSLFSNVHIHDNNGEKDKHFPLGEGSIDFREVISLMSSYSGNYIIEAKSVDMESALGSKRYLEAILE